MQSKNQQDYYKWSKLYSRAIKNYEVLNNQDKKHLLNIIQTDLKGTLEHCKTSKNETDN